MTIGVDAPQLLTAPWSPVYTLTAWYFFVRHNRWGPPDQVKRVKYGRAAVFTLAVLTWLDKRDGNWSRIHPSLHPDAGDNDYHTEKRGIISMLG